MDASAITTYFNLTVGVVPEAASSLDTLKYGNYFLVYFQLNVLTQFLVMHICSIGEVFHVIFEVLFKSSSIIIVVFNTIFLWHIVESFICS